MIGETHKSLYWYDKEKNVHHLENEYGHGKLEDDE